MYLIEKYCGHEIALQSSRCRLVDLDCVTQSPFAMFNPEKNRSDSKILEAQEWIENNHQENIDITARADAACLSLRQFNRRFKSASGETVNNYLQLVMVDAAKVYLVNTGLSFEEISTMAGYENISFSRRIFKKVTSVTPAEYRRRFGQV